MASTVFRFAACGEYDGCLFSGWQTQKDQRTVQEELEKALSKVANQAVAIITAGRTDAKVHATGQIIHFETTAVREEIQWHFGVNRFLPSDIRVHWLKPVGDEFHARFSAVKRSYRYIIFNNRVKPCLHRHYVSHVYNDLDVDKMQLAAQAFIGEHDFSSIRAAGCQAKTAVREIMSLELQRSADWVWFDVTANAFLQHMVRNIAGMLIAVGSGDKTVDWAAEVIAAKDRKLAGVTALPNGLYLVKVEYPEQYQLPEFPSAPIFW